MSYINRVSREKNTTQFLKPSNDHAFLTNYQKNREFFFQPNPSSAKSVPESDLLPQLPPQPEADLFLNQIQFLDGTIQTTSFSSKHDRQLTELYQTWSNYDISITKLEIGQQQIDLSYHLLSNDLKRLSDQYRDYQRLDNSLILFNQLIENKEKQWNELQTQFQEEEQQIERLNVQYNELGNHLNQIDRSFFTMAEKYKQTETEQQQLFVQTDILHDQYLENREQIGQTLTMFDISLSSLEKEMDLLKNNLKMVETTFSEIQQLSITSNSSKKDLENRCKFYLASLNDVTIMTNRLSTQYNQLNKKTGDIDLSLSMIKPQYEKLIAQYKIIDASLNSYIRIQQEKEKEIQELENRCNVHDETLFALEESILKIDKELQNYKTNYKEIMDHALSDKMVLLDASFCYLQKQMIEITNLIDPFIESINTLKTKIEKAETNWEEIDKKLTFMKFDENEKKNTIWFDRNIEIEIPTLDILTTPFQIGDLYQIQVDAHNIYSVCSKEMDSFIMGTMDQSAICINFKDKRTEIHTELICDQTFFTNCAKIEYCDTDLLTYKTWARALNCISTFSNWTTGIGYLLFGSDFFKIEHIPDRDFDFLFCCPKKSAVYKIQVVCPFSIHKFSGRFDIQIEGGGEGKENSGQSSFRIKPENIKKWNQNYIADELNETDSIFLYSFDIYVHQNEGDSSLFYKLSKYS